MREIIEVIALVLTGPLVGVEFAVAAFAHPVIGRLDDEAFARARSDDSRVLGKVMPFWYIATLLALSAAAVFTAAWLTVAAAALMAIVVLMTVTLMVPINTRIGRWVGAADVSRDEARRWDRLHGARVALLVAAFALLVLHVVG